MITTIPDRERTLQAEVDALKEELERVEASNRIRGDELARLRAVEPVAPPGWREALQFYADGSHFVIADEEAWDTVSGEPSNFWCDDGTATVEDGTVAKMALAGTPLSDEDDDGAAPPAQPAEPVQRLSDDRIKQVTQSAVDDLLDHIHENGTIAEGITRRVCRIARAIESAIQPQWRDIESAPKDGSTVIVGRDMGHFGFIRGYARWECSIDGLVPGWISCGFDPVNSNLGLAHPTHWQPLPPAPKASHD